MHQHEVTTPDVTFKIPFLVHTTCTNADFCLIGKNYIWGYVIHIILFYVLPLNYHKKTDRLVTDLFWYTVNSICIFCCNYTATMVSRWRHEQFFLIAFKYCVVIFIHWEMVRNWQCLLHLMTWQKRKDSEESYVDTLLYCLLKSTVNNNHYIDLLSVMTFYYCMQSQMWSLMHSFPFFTSPHSIPTLLKH
jgi:hypothetical protein